MSEKLINYIFIVIIMTESLNTSLISTDENQAKIYRVSDKLGYIFIDEISFIIDNYHPSYFGGNVLMIYYADEHELISSNIGEKIYNDEFSKSKDIISKHIFKNQNKIVNIMNSFIIAFKNYTLFTYNLTNDIDGYGLSFVSFKMSVDEFIKIFDKMMSFNEFQCMLKHS